jgi:hypothetical protein
VRELLETAIDVDHVNRLGWTAPVEVAIWATAARATSRSLAS